uniref:Uncharacterized protein n=1 Tax=Rhodosorus marinus TaxID=101924 RepID=A0A7S0G302_9RHOD
MLEPREKVERPNAILKNPTFLSLAWEHKHIESNQIKFFNSQILLGSGQYHVADWHMRVPTQSRSHSRALPNASTSHGTKPLQLLSQYRIRSQHSSGLSPEIHPTASKS